MGTRSITRIFEKEDGKLTPYGVMYRQFDGYPTGQGKDLAEFCKDFTIYSGYPDVSADIKAANGGGCFVAQLLEYFKGKQRVGRKAFMVDPDNRDGEWEVRDVVQNPIGNIYYYPVFEDTSWLDYEYSVTLEAGKEPTISCKRPSEDKYVIKACPASNFLTRKLVTGK